MLYPSLGGERKDVQSRILAYAREIGWAYVSARDAEDLRVTTTSPLFKDVFVTQLVKLNADFMTEDMARDVMERLVRVAPTIEGSQDAWEYLTGEKTVFVPSENRERNVRLIDCDNIDNNTFHVTDEFTFTNGVNTIRADVVFLINGIPVYFVETKAAHKIDGMDEALRQVKRYHRQCPELLAVLQIYSITHLIKYYYSSTWTTSAKLLFNWRDEVSGDFEHIVKSFFDRARCISIVTDYILFTRADDELKKVVLRPHQMRAVSKIVDRAADTGKRRGLIWHTQGSGKTYTMIVTAKQILENPVFNNPLVIMLIDRNELETQLFGNITAAGINRVEVASSKRQLRELLSTRTSGLIVSMIHKFDKIAENINTGENIFVLIDEAHRTTGGTLGNYLMGALPNATYLGFTGMPIDQSSYGKGTFKVFGRDDPPHGYLDKYGIKESIKDGTTVPLHYALAPNELLVDRDTLERDFLDLAAAEGVSDVDTLNKILDKAVTIKNMLKNPERIDMVAQYVARHFTETVEPLGYKAFLVAVDREACALYKDALDNYLDPDYSEVVYSSTSNERYHLSSDQEKQIRKDYKRPDKLPKILIVTNKLLTGFDAPVLYCIYLDKPMRDHVLLQSIARVNRPYEDKVGHAKPSGFILDFVGVFGNLKKALKFDSADIEGVVQDVDVLKHRFSQLMDVARGSYLALDKDAGDKNKVELVLKYFADEERRQEFYSFYREVADIYDIISPDKFLRPYIDEYETLTRMYNIVKEQFEDTSPLDSELSRKTARLVQKNTHTDKIAATLMPYTIDEALLGKLEQSETSDTEKVFNLIKSIKTFINDHKDESPYLVSIGQKAEDIAKRFMESQEETQHTLEELKTVVAEINEGRRQQKELEMSKEGFAAYWVLNRERVREAKHKAKQIETVFADHPYWKTNDHQAREVKKEIYLTLIDDFESTSEIKDITDDIFLALRGYKHDNA